MTHIQLSTIYGSGHYEAMHVKGQLALCGREVYSCCRLALLASHWVAVIITALATVKVQAGVWVGTPLCKKRGGWERWLLMLDPTVVLF